MKDLETIENKISIHQNSKKRLNKIFANQISKNTLTAHIRCKLVKIKNSDKKRKIRLSNTIKNGLFSQIVDRSQFECPICMDLLVHPVLRSCGHVYCYRCIETLVAHQNSCCICRHEEEESQLIQSKLTELLIKLFILPIEAQIYKYLCRSTDSQEWAKRRKITHLEVGMKVDYRDFTDVWRRAAVMGIFLTKSQQKIVDMRIRIDGQDFIESVNSRSSRLAYCNFFTKKQYLEDFPPRMPQLQFCQTQEKELQSLQYKPRVEEEEDFFSPPVHNCESQSQSQQHQEIQNQNRQSLANSDSNVLSAIDLLNSSEFFFMI